MSIERAKAYLKQYGMESRVMEFTVSSATVKEAAEALHCKEEEIAKTLSFLVNDETILVVTSGDQKIDNSKFKAEFRTKAKMIPLEEVEKRTGHAAGGVCPFGRKEDVMVYFDQSLKRFQNIYPACGNSNSAIQLKIEELENIVDYEKWVDVCKKIIE